MEALRFYVKIGEGGRIELPELGKLKGRKAELIVVKRLGKIKQVTFERIVTLLNRLIASDG